MSYSIDAGNIDAIEQSLESGAADAGASGLPAGSGATTGDLAAADAAGPEARGAGALAFQTGTDGPDTILGGEGTDVIDARGGDDRASGSSGDDLVFGRGGNDYLTGDGALAGPVSYPYPPAGDDTILGGDGGDTIYGDGFVSYDHAGDKAGDNLIFGGAGDDVVIAGYGADTVSGGSGDDLVLGYGSSGPTPGATSAYRDQDRADLLFGGDGADTVSGGGGADTIRGDAGDDRLAGGVGVDNLAGGAGDDTFVFAFSGQAGTTPDTGVGEGDRDVIIDFESGADLLDLTGYGSGLEVTWAYDEAGDRTVVTVVTPRSQYGFPNLEIELAGVQSLTADDILV